MPRTSLGARCREFESPHSEQNSAKLFDFAEFFFIIRLVRDKRSKVYFNLAPTVSI